MIPIFEPNLEGKELEYVTKCVKTGWISTFGEYVETFEKKFSEFCQTKNGVSCCNGTAALHLALMASDVGPGDEVIVPNFTFPATANTVIYSGAKPVLVDSDKESWLIDPDKIKKAITSKTKAIIPVHLYGNPCNMDIIMEIAQEKDLIVIEDCAQAHGAEFRGKKVGSIGHIGCFSFFANKIITSGEGGMCTTNDQELSQKIRILKDHGMRPSKKYWVDVVGYNYRLTNLQAAIGLAQLERIDEIIKSRKTNDNLYRQNLQDIKGVKFQEKNPSAKRVFWLHSLSIDDKRVKRDELIQKLLQRNIQTRPAFYPLNQMNPYKTMNKFPISERLSETGISLPSSTSLKPEDINMICQTFIESYK